MPADFNGYWKMLSNDNFEEYLKALGKSLLLFIFLFGGYNFIPSSLDLIVLKR